MSRRLVPWLLALAALGGVAVADHHNFTVCITGFQATNCGGKFETLCGSFESGKCVPCASSPVVRAHVAS